MSTTDIRVRNWERFQHYKDRSPPWIKLHRDLIEECEEWYLLSDGAARLLIELWVMASRSNDGAITRDVSGILWKLRKHDASKLIAELHELASYDFITLPDHMLGEVPAEQALSEPGKQDASTPLAECLQVATPEREGEGERARVAKRKCALPATWEPKPVHIERAAKELLDLDREVEKFTTHAKANGRKQLDWDAAFTQWLIRAVEYKAGNGVKGYQQPADEPIRRTGLW